MIKLRAHELAQSMTPEIVCLGLEGHLDKTEDRFITLPREYLEGALIYLRNDYKVDTETREITR